MSAACRAAAEHVIAQGVSNSDFFRLTYGTLSRHKVNNHQEPFSCGNRSCILRIDFPCFRGGVLCTLPNLQEREKEKETQLILLRTELFDDNAGQKSSGLPHSTGSYVGSPAASHSSSMHGSIPTPPATCPFVYLTASSRLI